MEFRKTEDGQRGKLPSPCILCTKTVEDDAIHGKFYVLDEISVHYYCLLFACALEQKGDDSEGILGFLKEDIIKEGKRGKKLKCCYCDGLSATIGCVLGSCRKQFHRPCGVENGALYQFFGQFKSFCCDHRPVQTFGLTPAIKKGKGKGKPQTLFLEQTDEPADCPICYEAIVPEISNNVLWAPCCRKRAWFHRDCVQQMALSAGYHFRCPLCNDKKVFKNEMKQFGIYIPDQDAAWEQVPNPYQELYERYCHCDAAKCICPRGRSHDGKNGGKWGIVLCDWCGSQGSHVGCSNLSSIDSNWECTNCATLARDDKLEKLPKSPVVRPVINVIHDASDSDEEIDVCTPMTQITDKLSKVVGSMFLGELSKTAAKQKTTARKSTSKNGVGLSPDKVKKTVEGAGPSHSGRRLVKFGATQLNLDFDYLMRSIQANNIQMPTTLERVNPAPKLTSIPQETRLEPLAKEKIQALQNNGLSFGVVAKVKPAPLSVKKKLLEKAEMSEKNFPLFDPVKRKAEHPARNVAKRGGFRGAGRSLHRNGSEESCSETSSLSSLSPSPPPKLTEELRFRVGPDGRILSVVLPEQPPTRLAASNLPERKYKPGPKSKKHPIHIPSPLPVPAQPAPSEIRLKINRPCPKSKKLLLLPDDNIGPCSKTLKLSCEADSSVNDNPESSDLYSGLSDPVRGGGSEAVANASSVSSHLESLESDLVKCRATVTQGPKITVSHPDKEMSVLQPGPIDTAEVAEYLQHTHEHGEALNICQEKQNDKTEVKKARRGVKVWNGPYQSDIMVAKERLAERNVVVNQLWDSYENGHGMFVPSSVLKTTSGSKGIVVVSRTAIKRK